jgi:MtfA peptidase
MEEVLIAPLRRWYREHVLRRHAIPDAVWQRVVREIAVLRALPSSDAARLRELAVMFLHGKHFVGVHGLRVDHWMGTSLAALAALPILNLGIDWYRGWRSVLVYEGAFVARHAYEDEFGLVHEEESALDGETSLQGPVILAWDEVARGFGGHGVDDYPGNVVLHELAHKLDYLNGDANGFPPLHATMRPEAWSACFLDAYESFCEAVDDGRDMRIDPYAAENPAEFFAVVTEVFFVAPDALVDPYPQVYEQLSRFFRQDPLTWSTH